MYDLIIIGGGPAGLTSGIYAQRARLKTVLLEREMVGGQIAMSHVIENYPGFPSISGMELMQKFEEHARGLGLEIRTAGVEDIAVEDRVKVVKTVDGDMRAKAVIVATGAKPKRIGVAGEKEFLGKGVSYCATCDGPFFRGRRVVVVGGGDTAIKEAVYLSKLAEKVYVVHRRDSLRAEKILQERALSTPNMEFFWSHIMKEIRGAMGVTGVRLKDLKTNDEKEVAAEGVFVLVGINPTTDFVDAEKDGRGFIKTNDRMETSIPGIYAAGDCRAKPLLQVSTAVGDGAVAAFVAQSYTEDFDRP
ncbi:MAG: thioredoxin-disulfide reductase [Deltaproteobacteria bacterium]|nr:thioredoxin-disulfide reductase [Deltaproteobacteria bacterium]